MIGALVPSANDAATTLAVAAGGTLPRFVASMNRTARELGLDRTHYANPHGLDAPGHVSTASDSAKLLRAASASRSSSGTSARAARRCPTVAWSCPRTTRDDPRVVGGKTGHTAQAGWSQVAFARSGGVGITAAVLGSPSEAQRDADLAALLRFGLASYRPARVVDRDRTYALVTVGWEGAARARRAAQHRPPGTDGTSLVERVVAPRSRRCRSGGPALGTVVVRDGNRIVARSPLVAARTARRRSRRRHAGSPGDRRPAEGARLVIITVTLNAALDRSVTVPILQLGQRHRASDVLTLAGGKASTSRGRSSASTSPSLPPASPAAGPARGSSRSSPPRRSSTTSSASPVSRGPRPSSSTRRRARRRRSTSGDRR